MQDTAHQPSLFASPRAERQRQRCQVFTPIDAAEALYRRFLGDLPEASRIVEPTCGVGNLLRAIPAHMQAVGIELDPDLAAAAQRAIADRPGWRVLVGDFAEAELPWPRVEAIFANPPWEKPFVDRLLEWAYDRLEDEGRCALMVPFSYSQYSATGMRLAERWAIESVELPRDLFFPSRLQETVSFKVFTKTQTIRRVMVGMFLYAEVLARRALDPRYQQILREDPKTWRQVVAVALARLGGVANLKELYAEISHRNWKVMGDHWMAKIRQQLQMHPEFIRVGDGRWALA